MLGCKYNFLAVFGIYVCIRFLYLYLVLQRGMTGSGCGVLGCEYNHLIHRARASTGPLCFLFTHQDIHWNSGMCLQWYVLFAHAFGIKSPPQALYTFPLETWGGHQLKKETLECVDTCATSSFRCFGIKSPPRAPLLPPQRHTQSLHVDSYLKLEETRRMSLNKIVWYLHCTHFLVYTCI